MGNSAVSKPGLLVAGVIVIAVAAGAWAALRIDFGGSKGNRLPANYQYDPKIEKTDPAQVIYREAGAFPVSFNEARGVAVGPRDRVFVVGDRSVAVFESSGARALALELPGEPYAVAVAPESHERAGSIYVALKTHVEVRDPEGKKPVAWKDVGSSARLTSIAVTEKEVLVADAGSRVVHRYDLDGKLLGKIDGKDPMVDDQRGFFVPSPHFDVAVSADGMIWVVNPMRHRIEQYTPDGHFENSWSHEERSVAGFSGCCNPVAIAILPDQSFVTAEKGVPRVKVYSPEGKFVGVVAGQENFVQGRPTVPELDVAADSKGRVLVLDPQAGKVRIFEKGGT